MGEIGVLGDFKCSGRAETGDAGIESDAPREPQGVLLLFFGSVDFFALESGIVVIIVGGGEAVFVSEAVFVQQRQSGHKYEVCCFQ